MTETTTIRRFVAFAALAGAGCGKKSDNATVDVVAAHAERGGTLVVALKSEPDSLNIYLARTSDALLVANRILPRLAKEIAPDGSQPLRFDPELADSWAFSDEGRTLTFKLHPKGSWSDGQPLGCADVQFTYRAQTSPELAWRLASLKRHITAVECPDAQTVVFRYDVSYPAQFFDANDLNILPATLAHVPFSNWRSYDWAHQMPTGGAFRIDQVTPGQQIALKRHEGFLGGPERPFLERLVLRPVPDGNARLTGLLAGDFQIVDDLQPADMARANADPNVRVERRSGWRYTYVGWNTVDPTAYRARRDQRLAACKDPAACPEDPAELTAWANAHRHPLLGDAKVRRALTLAIDRTTMVDTLLLGEAEVPATPILAPLPEHDPQLAPPPFDPKQARALLSEAGFADTDKDGTIDRGGKPFAITLAVQAGNALRKSAAELIQRDLGALGIVVTIQPIENSSFFPTLAQRGVDAWVGGWSASTRVDMTEMLHSQAAISEGNNFGTWADAEADALALAARDTAADASRAAQWHTWERIFLREQPYTMLFRPRLLVGVRRNVQGTASLTANDILNGVESWWLSSR